MKGLARPDDALAVPDVLDAAHTPLGVARPVGKITAEAVIARLWQERAHRTEDQTTADKHLTDHSKTEVAHEIP